MIGLRGGVAFTLLATSGAATILGGYGPGRAACSLSDPRITESSGVASASWADDFIWTHNDSGDQPRFFGVDTATCGVAGAYRVTGAEAVDWEDMARSGTMLHFGDIGDNDRKRSSITIYDVPEPTRGTPSGMIRPAATRILTYPDGPQDAESLFVDPATGRLAVVNKVAAGQASVYLAPSAGNGVMEKVASIPVASATAADATADRIIVRNYLSAWEWPMSPGESLGNTFGREPASVTLPLTVQGEAVAYARNGAGLWTTSEGRGSRVYYLPGHASEVPAAPPASAEPPTTSSERNRLLSVAIAAPILAVAVLWGTRRRRG